jgi:pilus assembly protein CpaD
MMRKLVTIAGLTAGLALTGCMNTGTANRSVESIHQPIVNVNNFALDAPAHNGILSPAEAQRVSDWLDAMDVRYGDQVAIDDSVVGSSRGARDTVAMLLARKGLLLADNAPITGGSIPSGNVRIIVSRASAQVPGCPDWGTRSASDRSGRTGSNYGCSVNSNMAAMVANPRDLVGGQSRVSNDPRSASRAIEAYRARPANGGTVSTSAGGSQ